MHNFLFFFKRKKLNEFNYLIHNVILLKISRLILNVVLQCQYGIEVSFSTKSYIIYYFFFFSILISFSIPLMKVIWQSKCSYKMNYISFMK